ncbi:MAG: DoxX family protein [Gemmatimonadaceae bacterium]
MTFFASSEKNIDRATLVLRLVLAAAFIGHGYLKVFQSGIGGTTHDFAGMGVPMPGITAPLISVLELGGGVLILFGAFTRVIAALLACDMLGAMLFVHMKGGFFAPKGIELVLGNFAMASALLLLGAGAFSVDAMLRRRGAPTP